MNAKLLYALLLNRGMLSQRNGWAADDGYIYVIYTIEQLARDLCRSARTVNTALNELSDAKLLVRKRQGLNRANLLFLKVPPDVKTIAHPESQDLRPEHEIIAPHDAHKLHPSDTNCNIQTINTDESGASHPRGEYQNVFLSDIEFDKLRNEFPDQYEQYIHRISSYMASTGKTYASHYVKIREWITDDLNKPQQVASQNHSTRELDDEEQRAIWRMLHDDHVPSSLQEDTHDYNISY